MTVGAGTLDLWFFLDAFLVQEVEALRHDDHHHGVPLLLLHGNSRGHLQHGGPYSSDLCQCRADRLVTFNVPAMHVATQADSA